MSIQTKTLSVRVKDKHAAVLRQMAFEVNQIFNLAKEITSAAYSNAGAFGAQKPQWRCPGVVEQARSYQRPK